jgi:2-polyprenyl-3-methyl-5-hydroxy-6-metoxy-1,4-benzoquinol methylase
MSIDFYEANAEDFFRRSLAIPVIPEHARFAAMLPAGGRVLDAGCGAGRDALAFREAGFKVTATEAAPALAVLARDHTGLDVQVLRFDQMDWREAFDGIWTCASLLHVPRAKLPETIRRLASALVPGGVWFMSFKYGTQERDAHGRRFTDLDEADAEALLAQVPELDLLSMEVVSDARPDRPDDRWLSLFCRRRAA